MPRRRDISGVKRPLSIDIAVDHTLLDDLQTIGDAWTVPKTTAAYWLLRGLIADARGDKLKITGDSASERLARWLVRKFPHDVGKD